jgi:hypothetical protein
VFLAGVSLLLLLALLLFKSIVLSSLLLLLLSLFPLKDLFLFVEVVVVGTENFVFLFFPPSITFPLASNRTWRVPPLPLLLFFFLLFPEERIPSFLIGSLDPSKRTI